MKWVKIPASKIKQIISKTLPPKIQNAINAELSEYVIKLPTTPTVAELHAQGYREWLIFDNKPDNKQMIDTFTPEDKKNYEAFVGGFLFYFEKHDSMVKDDDRDLLVDWGHINNQAALTIYLRPLYKPLYDKHQKEIKHKEEDSFTINGNVQVTLNRSKLPPPTGPSTDPPKPPAPPPPPRTL